MNDRKFCFIICSNSRLYFEECLNYIQKLVVPEGFEVEVLEISSAGCMTGGYNEGMAGTDAKYKIYMHQDVFILYQLFLSTVLDIFHSNDQIGMIGMVGTEKVASDGIMWHGYIMGALLTKDNSTEYVQDNYRYSFEDGFRKVEAIDGLMMITSKDILWREDIFDGWDFYDVSQSLEMKRRGYDIVVPVQKSPWCMHDDGILNFRNYNKYRKRFLQEYSEFL